MTTPLQPTFFGNPILREQARTLPSDEIQSKNIVDLLSGMYDLLEQSDFGIGLAAPQVGSSVALFVLNVKPTPTLPDLKPYRETFINPTVVELIGDPKNMREGCISAGLGENSLSAKVPRPNAVRLQWLDQTGSAREEKFEGFIAHTIQHEVDHLNGILFVDRVEDTTTYMLVDEYRKLIEENESV